MKKISIVVLVLMCGMTWVACKKSKSAAPDVFYTAGIHAKINGAAWVAQYVNQTSVSGSGHWAVEIDGKDSASQESLHIILPDFTGKGVRTITATSADKA